MLHKASLQLARESDAADYIFSMASELATIDAEDLKSRLGELRRFL
jgi:hypothetical protein